MATYTVSTTDELQRRVEDAAAGDEIIAEPGTYDMNSRWTVDAAGEPGNPVVIRGRESPFSGQSSHIQFPHHPNQRDDSGIEIRTPYVHFQRFEISGSGWKGLNLDGNPDNCLLEEIEAHDNYLWAIMVQNSENVTVRNCEAHHNSGGSGEGSDGFNGTGSTNCLFENCRSWANADDGYDFWTGTGHTIRNCWAWNNGGGSDGDGNGFKLGNPNTAGGGHRVEQCVSFNNKRHGFTWNRADNGIEMLNNTAVGNAYQNYLFRDTGPHVLKNNISADGTVSVDGGLETEANSWDLGLGNVQFRSLDPQSADFLRLPDGSGAIDAGTDVGLPYNGVAPDLGAFEYGGERSDTTTARITLDDEVTVAASEAQTNVDTAIESEHGGFNGDGYVQFEPDTGGYAQWALDVATAQRYNFEIRYANGGSGDRTANMTFAGTSQQVTFPQTGAWTTWDTLTGTVDLPDGNVDLAVETTGQDAGNVDRIRLWPVEPTEDEGESRAEPMGDTPNHGLTIPEKGTSDWHAPVNENFRAIDQSVPIVDHDTVMDQYKPVERALYIAVNTGAIYVGDGAEWQEIGSLD